MAVDADRCCGERTVLVSCKLNGSAVLRSRRISGITAGVYVTAALDQLLSVIKTARQAATYERS